MHPVLNSASLAGAQFVVVLPTAVAMIEMELYHLIRLPLVDDLTVEK
jgi:hypothetical protein